MNGEGDWIKLVSEKLAQTKDIYEDWSAKHATLASILTSLAVYGKKRVVKSHFQVLPNFLANFSNGSSGETLF
jgi:hypothetical protein